MAGFKDLSRIEKKAISKQIAHIWKTDSKFQDQSPESRADRLRAIDKAIRDKTEWDIPETLEELLTPPLSYEDGPAVKSYLSDPNAGKWDGYIMWGQRWWLLQLHLFDKRGKPFKYPDWQLAVRIGKMGRLDASKARTEIIKKHGEEGYEKWKTLVLSDVEARRQLLDAACSALKKAEIEAAVSYVTSPSSGRLLDSHGIPMKREHAFLFPELEGTF